jgi:hypothetical protein
MEPNGTAQTPPSSSIPLSQPIPSEELNCWNIIKKKAEFDSLKEFPCSQKTYFHGSFHYKSLILCWMNYNSSAQCSISVTLLIHRLNHRQILVGGFQTPHKSVDAIIAISTDHLFSLMQKRFATSWFLLNSCSFFSAFLASISSPLLKSI